jgi:hypothetical protein
MSHRIGRVVVIGAVLAQACLASAQQVRCLQPSTFRPAQDQRVTFRLVTTGDEARKVAWPDAQTRLFFARSTGRQHNRDRLDLAEGESPAWTFTQAGVGVIGLDLETRMETTTPEALGAFIDAHAPASLTERPREADEVEILRVESFKSLLRVGEFEGAEGVATDKTTLTVDIRPLFDPTNVKPGSTLAFRVYVEGQSIPGGRVTATHLASGRTIDALTDSSAIGDVTVDAAGAWLVEFHHVVPPEGDEPWAVFSCTMTFDVAGEVE